MNMEAQSQRFIEVNHGNRVIRLDTFERLDVCYNPLIVAQNQNKIAAAAANTALNNTPTANKQTNGSNGLSSVTASGSKKNNSSRTSLPAKVELPKVNIQIMSNYPVGIDDFKLPLNKVK